LTNSNPLSLTELVQQAGQLVTLPEIYYRLKDTLGNPNSTPQIIARIIESDTAMTARLLRLANSPVYSGYTHGSRVDRVSYAVQLAGLQMLNHLVLTSVLCGSLGHLASQNHNLASFWRHSVYTGLLATQLAKRCAVLHPDRLLAAGLIHDIGLLLMYQRCPDHTKQACSLIATGTVSSLEAEKQIFGYSHCEVGAELLKLWRLPDSLQVITAWHHHPQQAGSYALDAGLLHLANVIANQAGMAQDIGPSEVIFDPWAWEITGLDENVIAPVLEESDALFQETINLLIPANR
jgi:putative nucleotidyltransferase with HDIG domain